jgi:hypothetical protein
MVVQLGRGRLATGSELRRRQVYQVMTVLRSGRLLWAPAPALPGRPVSVLEELVVVQLVATGAGVALVLRHRVGHRLVHVHVDLGAEHRHVVA